MQRKGLFVERFKGTAEKEVETEKDSTSVGWLFCIFSKSPRWKTGPEVIRPYVLIRENVFYASRVIHAFPLAWTEKFPPRIPFPSADVLVEPASASLNCKISRENSSGIGSRRNMLPANVPREKLFGK